MAMSAPPIIERQVARADHVDAGRVGCLRVLANRPHLQPEARALEDPPRRGDDDEEGDPGQPVLVEDRAGIAQEGERVDGRHRLDALELAPLEDEPVRELREADEADGETDARDVLVRAEGDGHEGHHRPGADADHDRGEQAEEG